MQQLCSTPFSIVSSLPDGAVHRCSLFIGNRAFNCASAQVEDPDRGTFPSRKPLSRANAVSHNSSSRQTNVSTLAVLRVLYVQESHARRFPSASCRSALQHRMQQQAVDSGTGIATCGTDCTSAFEFHDAFGTARSASISAAPSSTAQPAPAASPLEINLPCSTREHRDERTSAHGCTTASSAATAPIVVPAGTVLHVRLVQSVGSKISQEGQRFDATLSSSVVVKGEKVIPAGTRAVGTVTEAHAVRPIQGRSHTCRRA